MSRTDKYFKDGEKVGYFRDYYDELWDVIGYGGKYNCRKRYRRTPVKWKQKEYHRAMQGQDLD